MGEGKGWKHLKVFQESWYPQFWNGLTRKAKADTTFTTCTIWQIQILVGTMRYLLHIRALQPQDGWRHLQDSPAILLHRQWCGHLWQWWGTACRSCLAVLATLCREEDYTEHRQVAVCPSQGQLSRFCLVSRWLSHRPVNHWSCLQFSHPHKSNWSLGFLRARQPVVSQQPLLLNCDDPSRAPKMSSLGHKELTRPSKQPRSPPLQPQHWPSLTKPNPHGYAQTLAGKDLQQRLGDTWAYRQDSDFCRTPNPATLLLSWSY